MGYVYVVNHSGHNIRPAKPYGEIKILSEGSVNIFATDRIRQHFEEELDGFSSEHDYILLCGSPILNVLAVLVALNKVERINVLIYNAKTHSYVVRRLSINIEEEEECQKSWKNLSDIDNLEMKLMLEMPNSLE